QPFRRHLDRIGMGRTPEAIAEILPTPALQDLLVAEMRTRKLPLTEQGWEKLASQSSLNAQRLSEIASGAPPRGSELGAIEALLTSTRQPDGSPWSKSDLKALVDRDFGE
ncbi:hypothetical protein, partial [Phormidium sp. CCY1219]|uniref:hypothetical protein n=1 Tax=Phormidium sp. CCY1219 TaxID=2886104 RepID=UPI002D1F70DC